MPISEYLMDAVAGRLTRRIDGSESARGRAGGRIRDIFGVVFPAKTTARRIRHRGSMIDIDRPIIANTYE
jgi:hypothetical protein